MAYRRRKNRGTWLPTIGSPLEEDSNFVLSGQAIQLPVLEDQIITTIIPVTADAPTYQDDQRPATSIMADVIGNEYFLDRIVGKLFLQTRPANNGVNELWAPVLVGAGFFVARADETVPNHGQPVGAQTPVEENNNYSPLDGDTIREPWIWRRTWILGCANNFSWGPGGQQAALNASSWPSANYSYGSVLDGPHIDAKTKRRVGQQDRLWFAIAASFVPGLGTPGDGLVEPMSVDAYLDYRLHGALRRARPDGKF